MLLAAPQADAAVTAVTFGFGSVLDVSDGSSYLTSTSPSFGTIPRWVSSGFYGDTTFRIGETFSQYGHFYQQTPVSPGNFGSGLATFLPDGTVIGNGGNGSLGMAYFASTNSNLDFTSDQLNKNIAFKTTTDNWGWARVSWDESAQALTFHEAWVESIPSTSITIGSAPEPGRALLALAGLGGIALRRRRKQVA